VFSLDLETTSHLTALLNLYWLEAAVFYQLWVCKEALIQILTRAC